MYIYIYIYIHIYRSLYLHLCISIHIYILTCFNQCSFQPSLVSTYYVFLHNVSPVTCFKPYSFRQAWVPQCVVSILFVFLDMGRNRCESGNEEEVAVRVGAIMGLKAMPLYACMYVCTFVM